MATKQMELNIVGRLVEVKGITAWVTFKMGDMPTLVIEATCREFETTEPGALVGLICKGHAADGRLIGKASKLHRLGAPKAAA